MSSPPTAGAERKYPGGRQKRQTRELHFSISGKHKIDIGKITALTTGRDAADTTATHIHIDSDHG